MNHSPNQTTVDPSQDEAKIPMRITNIKDVKNPRPSIWRKKNCVTMNQIPVYVKKTSHEIGLNKTSKM